MEDQQLWGVLGQAGIGVGALIILSRVVWRIGERMIEAIDKLSSRVDEHTKLDLAHHAKVSERLAGLEGMIEGVLDQADRFTPVGPVPRSDTPPRGVRVGRPGTAADKPWGDDR